MPHPNTKSHEIADILRTEILRQQYRSGERMPSERDLASRFDASRGAVREALSQLEQLGLINTQPGGARVRDIESASIAILGPLMELQDTPDPKLVDQFLRTFGALAATTAREALEKATPEQLNQMQKMVVLLSNYNGGLDSKHAQWTEFLKYLGSVADNLVVRLISNDLQAQFVEQMAALDLKSAPARKKQNVYQVLDLVRQGLSEKDAGLFFLGIQLYFDELRFSVVEELEVRPGSYQKQQINRKDIKPIVSSSTSTREDLGVVA